MNYNEVKQHGTIDFPFELYKLHEPSSPRYEMAMHWHSSVELIRVLRGKLYVTLDNRKYVAYSGDIIFVNSETAHGATPEDCAYECVVFNLSFMKTGNPVCDDFIEDLINKNIFVTEYLEDEEIKKTINTLFDTMNAERDGYKFKVFSSVYEPIHWILMKFIS